MKALISIKWQKKKSDIPVYQQIVDFLRTSIENGDLPPMYVMPGHRKMATLFGVSINTMIHVMQVLKSYKLIEMSVRSKAVVTSKPTTKLDWNKYISRSLYNPKNTTFFSFAENHVGALNLSMGLDKDYYFREMYNEVLPNLKIPEVMATSPFGLPLLREEICKYMSKYGIHANQKQVMIVTSVFYAMNVLFLGLLGHGMNLIVPKPCSLSISNLVSTTGANIIEIPIDENGIIIERLRKAVQPSHNYILCISPDQNVPTGTVTSMERRLEILDICTKYKVPIIEYTFFPLGCTLSNIPSIKSMDKTGNTLHLSQIGVTGSTNPWLGWIICDEYLLKRLNNIRFNLDLHQNYLTQVATLEIFNTDKYDSYLKHIYTIRKKRVVAVTKLLNKYLKKFAEWNTDNIDACIWLKFKNGINSYNIYKDAANVTFHPGKFYDDSDYEHAFVCPTALSLQNLELGLSTMAKLAEKQI